MSPSETQSYVEPSFSEAAPPNFNEPELRFKIYKAAIACAERTRAQMRTGLVSLEGQFSETKGQAWQINCSDLLSRLNNNAMDALDIQSALGYINKAKCAESIKQTSQAYQQAFQALMSTPSPVGAAVALSKNLKPFVSRCQHIINDVAMLIERESRMESNRQEEYRNHFERPSDSSNPSVTI